MSTTYNRTVAFAVASACALLGFYVFSQRASFEQWSPGTLKASWLQQFTTEESPQLVCNPYEPALKGILQWDGLKETSPEWKLLKSDLTPQECHEPPNWLDVLKQKDALMLDSYPYQGVGADALRDKTVLILGDSVDRNGHLGLAKAVGASNWPSSYQDASFRGVPPGWDWNGIVGPPNLVAALRHALEKRAHLVSSAAFQPFISEYPNWNLTMYSMFAYGMDDTDERTVKAQHDWRAPGKFEDRIDQLFAPFIEQTGRQVDMVVLHAGMWDFARWGRQDTSDSKSTALPLSEERVQWWMDRMSKTIEHARAQWPEAKIWIRTVHRVGTETVEGKASYDFNPGLKFEPGHLQNFFTDVRGKQLRDMQNTIAQQHCLGVIDFGHVWEGYQHFQDKVHPKDHPGVFAYANPMLHALYMSQFDESTWLFPTC